jgi:hypothetical protein
MRFDISKFDMFRGIISVLQAASDEPERIPLYQVQVWHKADRFYLAATNGFYAAVFVAVDGCIGDIDRVAITQPDAKFLAGILDLDKPKKPDEDSDDDDPLTVELTAGKFEIECSKWSVRLPTMAELGPDIESLVTGTTRGMLEAVAVNSKFLAKIAQAFRKAAPEDPGPEPTLQMSFGPTDRAPVLVTCPMSEDLSVILMPVALGGAVECVEEVTSDGKTRQVVRLDTGEVLVSEDVRQTAIPGTEGMEKAVERFQRLADEHDMTLSVSVNGGAETVVAKPSGKKKGKKAPAESEVAS